MFLSQLLLIDVFESNGVIFCVGINEYTFLSVKDGLTLKRDVFTVVVQVVLINDLVLKLFS